MAEWLLELFSEEIPSRMQGQAAADLDRLVRASLTGEGVAFADMRTYAGPRRLTLVVDGLTLRQPDRLEERKGPKSNAPEAALAGFLRSTGLTRDQLTERDGVFYASSLISGRETSEIIAETVDKVVRSFPWPKSMRWGDGTLRWVRPLHRIVCLLDGRIVPFELDGIVSGNMTEGHRFMGSEAPFEVKDFADYQAKLRAHHVILDVTERRERIADGARALCEARGLELVEDAGLLEEVAGLAEWPVPLLGDMNPADLDLPPEVIRTSMRTHQKYFAVRKPGQTGLAPHFVTVANIDPPDGGKLVLAGNGKVLAARLSDARFFWVEDQKIALEDRLEKLKGVTFHAKLGTMFERVQRIEALAREIAPLVSADADLAVRAARLAKADLGTGMVGEFPELQGVMGRYYAMRLIKPDGFDESPERYFRSDQAEDQQVCDAIRDHYKPQGPSDEVPTNRIGVAVALADKIDMLTGFFAIGEKPTGSKDPFALRRAALGVIRIIRENALRLSLGGLFPEDVRNQLLDFFADRLKVVLREEGKRHDLVDAVFALGDDDIVRIVSRVDALSAFLETEDGASLLAGYRRAVNILKAEEKKAPLPTGHAEHLPTAPEPETKLLNALKTALPVVEAAVSNEHFGDAMSALSGLRNPVDTFFNDVLVNDADAAIRANRLKLLLQIKDTFHRVADFSLIAG